jgi:hypothetical protein
MRRRSAGKDGWSARDRLHRVALARGPEGREHRHATIIPTRLRTYLGPERNYTYYARYYMHMCMYCAHMYCARHIHYMYQQPLSH